MCLSCLKLSPQYTENKDRERQGIPIQFTVQFLQVQRIMVGNYETSTYSGEYDKYEAKRLEKGWRSPTRRGLHKGRHTKKYVFFVWSNH